MALSRSPSRPSNAAVRSGRWRVACLFVPDFPLAAWLRAHPDQATEAVAMVEGDAPRSLLRAVTERARQAGVRPGMTVAQARAVHPEIEVRPVSPDQERAALAALADVAESFTPRYEVSAGGWAWLDLDGLQGLYPEETLLARAVERRASDLGLPVQIGIAGSKTAAALAARDGSGMTILPPGEEWAHLASMPVERLDPSPALFLTLQRWGIRTIGDLAALPAAAIGSRLGPAGVELSARARGEDRQPLVPQRTPLVFEESVETEHGIESLEPFLFVARPLIERLLARLGARGLVCGDLHLSLRLASRARDDRRLAVAVPTNERKLLLSLLRGHLENHPPLAAVEAIRLTATAEAVRPGQLDLFRPAGPAPARLGETLARLVALCGADRVGAPAVMDSHRPDPSGRVPFPVGETAPSSSPPAGSSGSEGWGPVLRMLRPPRRVEVFCQRDRPEFVRGAGLGGRVVQAAGPWRLETEWWDEAALRRDYYDVQLSDGGVYRLFLDGGLHGWFVDGCYD